MKHSLPRLFRRSSRLLLCFLLLLGVCLPAFGRAGYDAPDPGFLAGARPASQRSLVLEVFLHDTLQPVSQQAFQADMQAANDAHPILIVLNLSTPGGTASSAASMASVIEHSAAPVVVYVREPGTHVSGEGLQLLQAGDVRVMHPEATLIPASSRAPRRQALLSTRATLEAALRASAVAHDRPFYGISTLLDDPDTVSASEAESMGVIDFVVSNEDHLLTSLNGLVVHRANGSTQTLRLADAFISKAPMTVREHMMRALMNPDLAVLLLTLGGLLLYLEINTPGGILPGAAGLLLVLLAVYALLQMPLRWEGVLLLGLAGLLLLAEAHYQRHTALAVISLLMLVVGLRLLVRAPIPEMEVDWGTAVGAGIGFGGLTGGLLLLGLKARRAKRRTGAEAMLGWLAVTQTPLAPEGKILVRGELWQARLSGKDAFIEAGEPVKVERAVENVLEVAPLPSMPTH